MRCAAGASGPEAAGNTTPTVFCAGGGCLRDVTLRVQPPTVERGKNARLICDYDLEPSDSIYVVKFYRGQREFYRYTPKEQGVLQSNVFPITGINVDVSIGVVGTSAASACGRRGRPARTARVRRSGRRCLPGRRRVLTALLSSLSLSLSLQLSHSNATQVALTNVGFSLTGNVSCEVTIDKPSFKMAQAGAPVTVIGTCSTLLFLALLSQAARFFKKNNVFYAL
ncbi:hypothetical protein ONE63_006100 [Megalurothrips usitatus]|uniref:Uncharacterized protein n=1 Tax=Megalurothrips usitatus TaxID=439358 RepID=A0AAV7XX88_9NEOP|nr:hypothetical protein ONE63_006100 [Megalurothrips usitatus]